MRHSTFGPRWGGAVKRYHSTPTLREQTVAQHTWNMMVLYHRNYGPPPPDVWVYMLYHDVAEVGTGDVPFYAKRNYPDIKTVMDAAEVDVLKRMNVTLPVLSGVEMRRIKWCDLMEMKLFASEEVSLGNSYMNDVIHNIDEALMKLGAVE